MYGDGCCEAFARVLVSLFPLPLIVDASVFEVLLPGLRCLNDRRSQLIRTIDELEVAQWRIVTITTTHMYHARETRRTVTAGGDESSSSSSRRAERRKRQQPQSRSPN